MLRKQQRRRAYVLRVVVRVNQLNSRPVILHPANVGTCSTGRDHSRTKLENARALLLSPDLFMVYYNKQCNYGVAWSLCTANTAELVVLISTEWLFTQTICLAA